MRNKMLYVLQCAAIAVPALVPVAVSAQLQAFGGRQNDNNCKTIYLVNPSENIYYIAGMKQTELGACRSFPAIQASGLRYRINLSDNEKDFLLLLPKDTIAYNVLMSAEDGAKEKEICVIVRESPEVIGTNNDKKRNRQIGRLDGRNMNLEVAER